MITKPLQIGQFAISDVTALISHQTSLAFILNKDVFYELCQYVGIRDNFFKNQEQKDYFEAFVRWYHKCLDENTELKFPVDFIRSERIKRDSYGDGLKNEFLKKLYRRISVHSWGNASTKENVLNLVFIWYELIETNEKNVIVGDVPIEEEINSIMSAISSFLGLTPSTDLKSICGIPYLNVSEICQDNNLMYQEEDIIFPLTFKLVVNDLPNDVSICYGDYYPIIMKHKDVCLFVYSSCGKLCYIFSNRFDMDNVSSLCLRKDESKGVFICSQNYVIEKILVPNHTVLNFWSENGRDIVVVTTSHELFVPNESTIGFLPNLYEKYCKEKLQGEKLLAIFNPRCLLTNLRFYGDPEYI